MAAGAVGAAVAERGLNNLPENFHPKVEASFSKKSFFSKTPETYLFSISLKRDLPFPGYSAAKYDEKPKSLEHCGAVVDAQRFVCCLEGGRTWVLLPLLI